MFVLLLPLGGRGGCPTDPLLIESDACYLSATDDSVTPNRFVPMTFHTIPDSFCTGAETIPDRASVPSTHKKRDFGAISVTARRRRLTDL